MNFPTLKPCPFCGQTPHIGETGRGDYWLWHPENGCAVFSRSVIDNVYVDALVEAWNKRAEARKT